MGKLSDDEDAWLRQATAAAIAAARKIVLGDQAAINKNTPVGRLSDIEWGWIICAGIFAWIATRAQQATVEGLDPERVARLTGYDPNPWDVGAVTTMLPRIAELEVDWSKPLADWTREEMITFLTAALNLVRTGLIARDLGGGTIIRKSSTNLNDEIPPL